MESSLIKETLKKGIQVYKDNFKALFVISLMYAAISVVQSLATLFEQTHNDGLTSLIGSIATLVTLYFSLTIQISMYIKIKNIIDEKQIPFGDIFSESKGCFWRFIGNEMLVMLPIIIPLATAFFTYRSMLSWFVKFPIIAACVVIIAVLVTLLFFAPISVIMDESLDGRVRYSKKLVGRRVLQVFILLFVSCYMIYVPFFFVNSAMFPWVPSPYFLFIKSNITNLINILVVPFSCSVQVVLYKKLESLLSVDR